MNSYILGYNDHDTTDAENPEHLTLFYSILDADNYADEYLIIYADSLAEAKLAYHGELDRLKTEYINNF